MNNQNLAISVESALTDLERIRLEIRAKIKSKSLTLLFVVLAIAGTLFIYAKEIGQYLLAPKAIEPGIIEGDYDVLVYVLISLLVVPTVIVIAILYSKGRKKFEQIYKDMLVRPLMINIFPDLNYEPTHFISREVFKQSNLYSHNFNNYNGDDFFSGKLNGKYIEFSELHVSESTGGKNNHTTPIFNGLFMQAHIEQSVNDRIIIDNRLVDQKIPAIILNLIKRFLPDYGPVILTGNEEFDRNFRLHSYNEEEAKRVISDQLMNKIIEINNLLKEQHEQTITNSSINTQEMGFIPGLILKIAVQHNLFYCSISGLKLFEVLFGKSTLESQKELTKSLTCLKMITEIAKSI